MKSNEYNWDHNDELAEVLAYNVHKILSTSEPFESEAYREAELSLNNLADNMGVSWDVRDVVIKAFWAMVT